MKTKKVQQRARIKKEEWIWMPHAGHLCIADMCRFHLNTYVNGYIVSTIGEYLPPNGLLKLLMEIKYKYKVKINPDCTIEQENIITPDKMEELKNLNADDFQCAYLHHFGYEEIGLNRTYETMVFTAKKQDKEDKKCCPWTKCGDTHHYLRGYKDSVSAFKGHIGLCKNFARRKKPKIPNDEE